MDFNKIVYTTKKIEEGKWTIEENTLERRVRDSAEETTSPRGVMPKLFVEGCELRYWQPNGRSRVVDEFDTEEEADAEWLNRIYNSDYMEGEWCWHDFDTMEDAIRDIADAECVSIEEAQKMIVKE